MAAFPTMIDRRGRLLVLALALASLAGCVQETQNGDTFTYRYDWWIPVAVMIAGAVAAPAGWALRKKTTRFSWTLMILGVLGVVGFGPSIWMDTVTVSPSGFRVQTGIYGGTVHDVKFADLLQIRQVKEVTHGRRTQTNYYLVCEKKDGSSSKVPLNKVVDAAAEKIVVQAVLHGVPLRDDTGE